MSEYQILAVISAFVFVYSLVAARMERTPINGALVYVACGLICGPTVLGLVDLNVDGEAIKTLAELTLAVVLFTDSATADLSCLRRVEQLPIRLLLIGLPLTIVFGFGLGYLLFGGMGIYAIALLATMLAPTDAALGKAVVTNQQVPNGVRTALNVESGLNDGICVPVLLIFLALATEEVSGPETLGLIARLPIRAIGIGALTGATFAILGSFAIRRADVGNWVTSTWRQVPIIALSLLCFATAQFLGGSGFISCFVAGLIFGGITRNHKEELLSSAEGTGDTLSLLTWFLFGAAVVGEQLTQVTLPVITYAVASLTIVRMLPVAISLIGMRVSLDTTLFLGWFGPRGLASIVFIVMVAAKKLPEQETLFATVTWTILLSVILHGITANPFAAGYAKRVDGRQGAV